jgi:hypothetical protein
MVAKNLSGSARCRWNFVPIAKVTLTLGLIGTGTGCGNERPVQVPEGAVEVNWLGSGGWIYCWLDEAVALNRCHMFNRNGDRIYGLNDEGPDDVFLRYDGGPPVAKEDLQIDNTRTGIGYVWLKNEVVLLKRNEFDTQKSFVDRLMRSSR